MVKPAPDRGDTPRARAQRGVRAWARAAGSGVRAATPYGIFAFLTASALAPVAVPALGLSGEFAAALGQLGGMGTNYLTDVLTGAAGRLRDTRPELTPEEWRDALAEALVPSLASSAGLRAEVGELLESVDAVSVALAEGTAQLRLGLAEAVRELGGEFAVSNRVLAQVQEQLAVLSADQRLLLELTRRSLLAIVQIRQALPTAGVPADAPEEATGNLAAGADAGQAPPRTAASPDQAMPESVTEHAASGTQTGQAAPDAATRQAARPDTPDPATTGPDTTGPATTGPDTAEITGPDTTGPDMAEADTAGPEPAGPDTAEADTAGPEPAGPDTAEANTAGPEPASPDTAEANTAGPEPASPDTAEADTAALAVAAGGDRTATGAAVPGAAGTVGPFPGLASFQTSDAGWFFGRAALVAELLGRLAEQATGGGPLMVVGASGAGKSSALRAGLLPALDRGGLGLPGSRDWPWLLLTPGPRPLHELAAQTAGLLTGVDALTLLRGLRAAPDGYGAVAAQAAAANGPPGARLVVVVDQFEELFTHGATAQERATFAAALVNAGPALVVLAVRADFYPDFAALPALAPALAGGQVVVGPLSRDGLRMAVLGPAARAGLAVEPGLVEVLLAELGAHPGADPEPAALPLLAHALRATWQRGDGRSLTVAGYRAAGGIANAVAETAEAIHAGLDAGGRAALRAGLLRMVSVTESGTVARRRAALAELPSPVLPRPVLDRLVAARLVTVGQDWAELSHEALLAAWPRLAGWVAAARQDLLVRQQLGAAARYWTGNGRDAGALYRGARLAQAREWAQGRDDLSGAEAEFLAASIAGSDAALRTERRRTRQLRRLVAALAVLLVLAPAAAAVAFTQRGAARQQREDAGHSRAEATSRQLATASTAARDADPRQAMLLALAGWQASPTVEARSALLSAQALDHGGRFADAPGGLTAAISPDGTLVAVGRGNGDVELWDARTHSPRGRSLHTGGQPVYTARFSPDGRLLATASGGGNAVRVWELPSGRLRCTLPGTLSVAWGAGGGALAAPYADRNGRFIVNVWDAATGRLTRTLPTGGRLAVKIAFSPDGRLVATGNGDGTASLLRVADGARLATLGGHRYGMVAVAFSADGRTLATGGASGAVRLWDGRTGRRIAELTDPAEEPAQVIALAFTPDGGRLLVAGGPHVRVWLLAGREPARPLSGGPAPLDVDVSADGHTVVAAGTGAPTTLWRIGVHWLAGHASGTVNSVAWDRSGRGLASTGADATARLWDLAGPRVRATASFPDQALDAAYGPDGTLAVGVLDGTVRLLDPAGRPRATLRLGGREPAGVAFSPDGTLLAAAAAPPARRNRTAEPGTAILLWDAHTLRPRGTLLVSAGAGVVTATVGRVAFTPDSARLLAVVERGADQPGTDQPGTGSRGTGPQRGEVWVWRTADLGRRERAIDVGRQQPVALAVSPDGRTVAVGGTGRTIGLWDLAGGAPVGAPFGLHPAAIRSLSFSPDGGTLASGDTADGQVRLWDVAARAPVASLAGHIAGLNEVAFGPDGRTVASAGEDGTVGVWDTDPDRVAGRLCQILSGPALAGEWSGAWSGTGTARPPALPCR
jgi:WD40 repeat protein